MWLPILELVQHFESIDHVLQVILVALGKGILEVLLKLALPALFGLCDKHGCTV